MHLPTRPYRPPPHHHEMPCQGPRGLICRRNKGAGGQGFEDESCPAPQRPLRVPQTEVRELCLLAKLLHQIVLDRHPEPLEPAAHGGRGRGVAPSWQLHPTFPGQRLPVRLIDVIFSQWRPPPLCVVSCPCLTGLLQ